MQKKEINKILTRQNKSSLVFFLLFLFASPRKKFRVGFLFFFNINFYFLVKMCDRQSDRDFI